ncbi:MAG: YdeI/OmpD-associated family protein [Cytophagales bacterium]|nr:YdeI/OmpD-associated family protein [Armatimonadota bacterium]
MTEPPPNSTHPLSRAEWRTWLAEHHTQPGGVWLIGYKKGTGKPRFDYDEAVEEALCFGWVDSKPAKLDDERSLLWFAPRKAGTGWSKPNKERVERLITMGLMTKAGLARVEAAKRDGSWNALDGVEALEIPPDLQEALAASEPALENFQAFPRSAQRGILEWILTAKRPETRRKRIEETARLAAQNERANQWRRGAPTLFPQ